MSADILDQVGGVIRFVAKRAIMPRFGTLTPQEIVFKGAGSEVVTVADTEAEKGLSVLLGRLIPSVAFVGEEGVASNPDILKHIEGKGATWVVDPINGTQDFVDGGSNFSVMVALVKDGDVKASWIYFPAADEMLSAKKGGGVWYQKGEEKLRKISNRTSALEHVKAAIIDETFIGREHFLSIIKKSFNSSVTAGYTGDAFRDIALGRANYGILHFSSQWEMGAGSLIVRELGNVMICGDSSDFNIAGNIGGPLFIASNREGASALRTLLQKNRKPQELIEAARPKPWFVDQALSP